MAERPSTPATLGPAVLSQVIDLIPRAERADGTPALGELAEELGIYYRVFAICQLADEGDAERLFQWLIHSALLRRHYLRTVGARPDAEPRYRRASFVDPLQDALCARQWKLAGQIGALQAPDWLERCEYEDDYCYGELLRQAAEHFPDDGKGVLRRWKKALQGGDDPRLSVAAAYLAKDAAAFEEALRSLVVHNERKAAELADPTTGSVLSSDYPFAPNRWVSIEGLAWLALAERDGLSVDYEVERCPRVARCSPSEPFEPRAYPNQRPD